MNREASSLRRGVAGFVSFSLMVAGEDLHHLIGQFRAGHLGYNGFATGAMHGDEQRFLSHDCLGRKRRGCLNNAETAGRT
jgi:hypothetical protein